MPHVARHDAHGMRHPLQVVDSMEPLLDAILDLPRPVASIDSPLQLQISNIGFDQFIGRLLVGRIRSGVLRKASPLGLSAGPGTEVKPVKASEIFVFNGMGRAPVEEAAAGDIVVVAGVPAFNIGDTIVDPSAPEPLPPITVEQPTMSITLGVNKSPLGGKTKGGKLTSSQIRERLDRELETNVALQVRDDAADSRHTPDAPCAHTHVPVGYTGARIAPNPTHAQHPQVREAGDTDSVQVFGRGLLHLTVLLESMRREGFEVMVGPPKVLYQEVDGKRYEPFETVDIDLPEADSGGVIEMLNLRKGAMLDMGAPTAEGMQTLQYEMPTRGLVGFKSKLLTATRGLAVMNTIFAGYKPYAGPLSDCLPASLPPHDVTISQPIHHCYRYAGDFGGRERGNLLSHEQGVANAFSLERAQQRGTLFLRPGDPTFQNQIIGVHSRGGDLVMNVCRLKVLDNMRSTVKEEAIKLSPIKQVGVQSIHPRDVHLHLRTGLWHVA